MVFVKLINVNSNKEFINSDRIISLDKIFVSQVNDSKIAVRFTLAILTKKEVFNANFNKKHQAEKYRDSLVKQLNQTNRMTDLKQELADLRAEVEQLKGALNYASLDSTTGEIFKQAQIDFEQLQS